MHGVRGRGAVVQWAGSEQAPRNVELYGFLNQTDDDGWKSIEQSAHTLFTDPQTLEASEIVAACIDDLGGNQYQVSLITRVP